MKEKKGITMSDHKANHFGFQSGIMLGIAIGAGLVFFLGTKKGKEILDEYIDIALEFFDKFDNLFEEPDTTPFIAQAEIKQTTPSSPFIPQLQQHTAPSVHSAPTTPVFHRRLFRGIPKRA